MFYISINFFKGEILFFYNTYLILIYKTKLLYIIHMKYIIHIIPRQKFSKGINDSKSQCSQPT